MKVDLEKIKIKAPPYLRLFITVFLFVNLIGIINFPFYEDRIKNFDLFFLLLLGFIGFTAGTLLLRLLPLKISPSKGKYKKKLTKYIFIISNLASFFLIVLTHVTNGGIIILMGSKRFTTFAYTNLFIYLGIISTLLLFSELLLSNKKIKLKHWVFIALQSLLVLSMGYRSPLIILIGGCLLIFIMVRNDYQNKYKNIFTVKNILFFLAFLALMSAISSYRVSQLYDIRKFFKNIDMDYVDENAYIRPFMPTVAVFRYDQEVIKKLIDKTENKPYNGGLAVSNFLTVLPGEQLGARNIVGQIIEARKFPDGKPWSITPTLQGALFVDWGYKGVFFGFFGLGLFIELLKKQAVNKKDPFSLLLYSLFAINALMLIHTGYFDVVVFLLAISIVILKFLIMRINYSFPRNIQTERL